MVTVVNGRVNPLESSRSLDAQGLLTPRSDPRLQLANELETTSPRSNDLQNPEDLSAYSEHRSPLDLIMSQGVCYGLVSDIRISRGKDVSVHIYTYIPAPS